jgi:hypothetical protein
LVGSFPELRGVSVQYEVERSRGAQLRPYIRVVNSQATPQHSGKNDRSHQAYNEGEGVKNQDRDCYGTTHGGISN